MPAQKLVSKPAAVPRAPSRVTHPKAPARPAGRGGTKVSANPPAAADKVAKSGNFSNSSAQEASTPAEREVPQGELQSARAKALRLSIDEEVAIRSKIKAHSASVRTQPTRETLGTIETRARLDLDCIFNITYPYSRLCTLRALRAR
jgi:hypothetical protein